MKSIASFTEWLVARSFGYEDLPHSAETRNNGWRGASANGIVGAFVHYNGVVSAVMDKCICFEESRCTISHDLLA
jgi:hypothetical protein